MGLVKTKLNDLIKDADKVVVGENVWELFAELQQPNTQK